MKRTLKKIIKNNDYLRKTIMKIITTIDHHLVPDSIYLKNRFKKEFGENLNLRNPHTFNEKLQWLKLNDRNPIYTKLADKFEVKKFISEAIGDEYLIPTLGVYDSFNEINFDELPSSFVLKCTHDSGSIVICKDKSNLNINEAKHKIEESLNRNYYYLGREWPYKDIKPRIICEKYMIDESIDDLRDYKIFCFSGEAKFIQVDFDRFSNHKRNLYDTDWNYIKASIQYPTDPNADIEKPKKLDEMLNLARVLSSNYPHVRIDFYLIGDLIFFGEFTFYHGSGFENIRPIEFNKKLGELIKLPNKI